VKGAFVYRVERAICEQSRTADPGRGAGAGRPRSHRAWGGTPNYRAAARSTHPKALCRRLAGDLDNVILMACARTRTA